MGYIVRIVCTFCMLFLNVMQGFSVEHTIKYYIVPFKVNAPSEYEYLGQAIPRILEASFSSGGHTKIVEKEEVVTPKNINSGVLSKIQQETGAGIIFFGEVSVVGSSAIIMLQAYKNKESVWRKTSTVNLNEIDKGLQDLSAIAKQEVFFRDGKEGSPKEYSKGGIVLQNQTDPLEKKQNAWARSQSLPFASVSIAVADVTGDKQKEVIFLKETSVCVYAWNEGRLKFLGEYNLPKLLDPLAVRTYDINGDGVQEILVTCYDCSFDKPHSLILSFKEKEFKEIAKYIPFYINVVSVPPDGGYKCIGQKGDSTAIFSASGVCEVVVKGNNVTLGSKLLLPKEANVFNFTWLSEERHGNNGLLILSNKSERLAVYSSGGTRLFVTDEVYFGSSFGINDSGTLQGFGKSKAIVPSKYFIPARMIPVCLDGEKGHWDFFISKPISLVANYLQNYRSFAEGEVQLFSWDGMGLESVWKSDIIKGTITDFVIEDIYGNGEKQLIIAVNTHPGVLSLEKRKTFITVYPLDRMGRIVSGEDKSILHAK